MARLTATEAQKIYRKYLVNACEECGAPVGKMCKRNNATWIHVERFRKYQNDQQNLYKTADLHEKTVQAVASRTAEFDKKFERVPGTRGKYRRRRNSRVKVAHWSDNVNPLIVAWVKENHPGLHPRKIVVVSPDQIIIHN